MDSKHLLTIKHFLSPKECTSLLETIESIGFQSQYSGTGNLIRSRAVFENKQWAQLIWNRLKPALPQLTDIYNSTFNPEPLPKCSLASYVPSELNERFRCYKYGVNEEFQKHTDFAHEYSNTKRTFLTVLIYLNEKYRGGETTFEHCSVSPQQGMLVMFPHELPHEGCKITEGFKYSLRTDIVYESSDSYKK